METIPIAPITLCGTNKNRRKGDGAERAQRWCWACSVMVLSVLRASAERAHHQCLMSLPLLGIALHDKYMCKMVLSGNILLCFLLWIFKGILFVVCIVSFIYNINLIGVIIMFLDFYFEIFILNFFPLTEYDNNNQV